MTGSHQPLFPDRLALSAFARDHAPPFQDLIRRERLVRRLNNQRDAGALDVLPETRVEASWIERLFAELLDYQTLLSEFGTREYHIQAKHRHGGSRFDDFCIGRFGGAFDPPIRVASCELKGPGTDLDARQMGSSYRGRTAVEQAHETAALSAEIQWVIVSNFDEIRLYRSGDIGRYELVRLRDVLGPQDLVIILGLFSRPVLLGDGLPSPLERFWQAGGEVTIPRRDDRIRLIQECRPSEPPENPIGFSRLEEGARPVLDGWPLWTIDGERMTVEKSAQSDRPGENIKVDLDFRGSLRVSTYVGEADGPTRYVYADRIIEDMMFFMNLGRHALAKQNGAVKLEFSWHVDECSGWHLHYSASDWSEQRVVRLVARGSRVAPAILHRCGLNVLQEQGRLVHFYDIAHIAARELLFPFVGVDRDGKPVRLTVRNPDQMTQHARRLGCEVK